MLAELDSTMFVSGGGGDAACLVSALYWQGSLRVRQGCSVKFPNCAHLPTAAVLCIRSQRMNQPHMLPERRVYYDTTFLIPRP